MASNRGRFVEGGGERNPPPLSPEETRWCWKALRKGGGCLSISEMKRRPFLHGPVLVEREVSRPGE